MQKGTESCNQNKHCCAMSELLQSTYFRAGGMISMNLVHRQVKIAHGLNVNMGLRIRKGALPAAKDPIQQVEVLSTSATMIAMLRPFSDLHLVETDTSIGPLLKKIFLLDGRARQDIKINTGPLGVGGKWKKRIMTRQQNLTVQSQIWYHIDWRWG